MSTLDDIFLIQQTLNGNRNAFRFLVLRYQKPIFKYLSSFGLPNGNREEIAQEAFIRAFKNLAKFDPDKGASFSTWLFVIAKNLAINEINKSSYKNEISTDDTHLELPNEIFSDNPETHLNRKQTQVSINNALNEVPIEFRRAVILSQISEHSLQEIAVIENCSIGTVKSRIFRGKEILRKILISKMEVL